MSEFMEPSLQDIQDAAIRLKNFAVRTPLLEAFDLSEKLGARIFIKAENLQRVGAFKFRGAYNRLCQLSNAEKARGVVAFSSGNHAQGVAAAAQILGLKAVIVMPADAPAMKRDNTLSYGAEVIEYDRETQSREDIAQRIAHDTGAIVVPSFEDFHIISGQGTAALEMIEQGRAMGVSFDQFLCPIGGGGLMSGCSTALNALSPDTEIHGVEPEGFEDVKHSLAQGSRQSNLKPAGSICDALLTQKCGAMTFSIMKKYVDSVLVVNDREALQAVKYAWEKLKIVVEPGGAVALAALLSGQKNVRGKNVCLMLSGGNIDEATFKAALDCA